MTLNKYLNNPVVGNNLDVVKSLPDECVDFVYADPLYMTQKIFKTTDGVGFEDKFENLDEYITINFELMQEVKRVLKPTGSLCIHINPTIDAEWRLLILDKLFNRIGDPVYWKRNTNSALCTTKFGELTDVLCLYSKSKKYKFNQQKDFVATTSRGYDFLEEETGRFYRLANIYSPVSKTIIKHKNHTRHNYTPPEGCGWNISSKDFSMQLAKGLITPNPNREGHFYFRNYVNQNSVHSNLWVDIHKATSARYPTEKPEKLLARLINTFTDDGDIIIDPFCGGGTTAIACKTLGRRFITCDLNPDAIKITRERLSKVEETLPFD